MADAKIILITGATGRQGGAVLRHLAKRGELRLRAFTRKPESAAARAVAALGAEVVKGDLDDEASIARALENVWGVFAVQNTWEAGVEREEEQGKRLVRLARARGVSHFVYSSVASAHRATNIPHFENKFRIEQSLRAAGFPSHVIIRPVFFMENLLTPAVLRGDKLAMAIAPTTKLQMIAVDDVGRFGALAFVQAERLSGKEFDLAGDSVTIPEAAAAMSAALGRRFEHQRVPIEEARRFSADWATMLEWFDRVGYDVDIAALERQLGIRPLRLGEWLRTVKRTSAAESRDRPSAP